MYFPYRLVPERNWEIDLDHVQSLLLLTMVTSYSRFPPGHHHDDHHHLIGGIVVNNPSNLTGAVYSLQHLQDLVTICNHYHLPIVADEIYGNMTYQPLLRPFIPMANVVAMITETETTTKTTTSRTTKNGISVPVITL